MVCKKLKSPQILSLETCKIPNKRLYCCQKTKKVFENMNFCQQFSRNTPRFSLVSGNWKEATETLQIMANWNNSTLPEGSLTKSIEITVSCGG